MAASKERQIAVYLRQILITVSGLFNSRLLPKVMVVYLDIQRSFRLEAKGSFYKGVRSALGSFFMISSGYQLPLAKVATQPLLGSTIIGYNERSPHPLLLVHN